MRERQRERERERERQSEWVFHAVIVYLLFFVTRTKTHIPHVEIYRTKKNIYNVIYMRILLSAYQNILYSYVVRHVQ